MKEFNERGSAVGSDVHISEEFGRIHHEKGADLLAFSLNDVGHDGIEQRHTCFHALFEHDFEGCELFLDGFFDGV